MEDSEWRNMLVVGADPKRLVFMKPEYRELVKTKLKQYYSDLFPTITVETNKEYGTVFRSNLTFLYFSKYFSDDSINLKIEYWFPEKGKWMDHYEILQETGDEDTYMGDPNEEDVIELLKDVYESNKDSTLETLTLKRSEIGWSDPITMDPIRSGDQIIRINKDNRFIFQRKALEKSWVGKEKKNPLTNQVVTPQQIEKFIANVTEDAGAEPMTGGRRKRRRKTLRRKNLRSSRKNK
jgi:hypothetical protein